MPLEELASAELIATFSGDERWTLVQRVVSSAPFARAPQLRGFLLFVCSRALASRLDEINEYDIGRVVLGRRQTFNPHEDNIVRVQARHLRSKLEQYFETDGRDERMVIRIPRGTYAPTFEPRAEPEPQLETVATAETVEVEVQAKPVSHPKRRVYAVAAGLLLVLAAVAAWLLPPNKTESAAVVHRLKNPLLTRVFHSGDSTKILMSDAGLVILQEFMHRRVSLEDYLNNDFPHMLGPQLAGNNAQLMLARDWRRPYTTFSDISAANRLQQLGEADQARVVLRHPRQVNIRDFESSSFVLLGGPLANPWYQLFEPRLNFVFEPDMASGVVAIRNKVPAEGEQPVYTPKVGPMSKDYAIVGLLPNLRGSGSVLLIAGTAMEGTEAAGEMIIRDKLPASLSQIVSRAEAQQPIEILIETDVVAGVPKSSRVVASRLHRDEL